MPWFEYLWILHSLDLFSNLLLFIILTHTCHCTRKGQTVNPDLEIKSGFRDTGIFVRQGLNAAKVVEPLRLRQQT